MQGADAVSQTITPASRVGNYTQIPTKTAVLAGTNAAVNSAGGVGKMGHVLLNKTKELKRDVESILFNNQARVAPTTTVAGKLAGIPAWLKSNINQGNLAVAPAGDGTNARTTGTARAFAQSQLDGVLLSCYQNTGKIPKLAFCAPKQKQAVSQIAPTGQTRYVEANGKKLSTSFDVYEGDFGQITLIPSIFQAAGTITLVDPDYMKIAYLRPFEKIPLSKIGDSDRFELLQELTLEVSNEKAHGAIYDLS